jgi:hypothetical protein
MQTGLFLGVLLALLLSVAGWMQGSIQGMGMVLAFWAASYYLVALARSRVEVDLETIVVRGPFGAYGIRWDEIVAVVTNGRVFAFQGEDKQLSVSLVLAGRNRALFRAFLDDQINRRRLAVQRSPVVPLGHHNSRVN